MGEPLTKEKSMSQTTFSGPVASQNGFVTPTYTQSTLPYFIQGNIVYVSDLNTLAFGGVDQWYRQDTGVGIGTGGGNAPAAEFFANIDFDYATTGFYADPTNLPASINCSNPTINPTLSTTFINMPVGKVFEVLVGSVTYSVTTTSVYSDPSQVLVYVDLGTTPYPPISFSNIDKITIPA
jgi:hypothetical protein